MKPFDLTGKTFGLLVAASATTIVVGARTRGGWVCSCACGKQTTARTDHLLSGATKSCGCARNPLGDARKHPAFGCWQAMLQRCHTPSNSGYYKYGAKGVQVCLSWRTSFQSFILHIGPKPSAKHSIDRIDNAKGYEPGNVRWATAAEQAVNKRNTVYVVFDNVRQPLATLAHKAGLCPMIVNRRVVRFGWSVERALTTPVQKRR